MQNMGDWIKRLVERVKDLILKPRETWEAIVGEEGTVQTLLKEYLLILAAIPAIASFLGRWIVGMQLPFRSTRVRLNFGESLLAAIVGYALTVLAVWLMGKVISFLAPRFGSAADDVKGFKVAVYTYTPYLAAGVLLIIPSLSILVSLAGLYGFYLLYVGLPIVMETPKDKALAYTVVVIVALILLYIIVGAVMSVIVRAFGPPVYIG